MHVELRGQAGEILSASTRRIPGMQLGLSRLGAAVSQLFLGAAPLKFVNSNTWCAEILSVFSPLCFCILETSEQTARDDTAGGK